MVMDIQFRGVTLTIAQSLFDQIISEALGFESGEISVLDVTKFYHHRAFEMSIRAKHDDERFPIVQEGCRYPTASLVLHSDVDGKVSVKGLDIHA